MIKIFNKKAISMFNVRPIDKDDADNFGERMLFGKKDNHTGIDIETEIGTPVSVVADGVVIWANVKPDIGKKLGNFGFVVVVKHLDGTCTLYAHLDKPGMKVGTKVVEGQVIGISGNTGRSTGPHLHFEKIDEIGTRSIEEWGAGGLPQDGAGNPKKGGKVALGLEEDTHRINSNPLLPSTSKDQLLNDPEILKQKEGYCEKVGEEYCEKFNQYLKRGTLFNPDNIEIEALKYFPELQRLVEMRAHQYLNQKKFFEWVGGTCGVCAGNNGSIFSYNNPPSCGFPPVHPNCGCSVSEVDADGIRKRFGN